MNNKSLKAIEDLNLNHNHSLWQEVYNRNKNNLDAIAIIYRGNKITYREMFEKIDEYAMSLKTMGYQKGDEIPVCLSNTPEFIYLFYAISKIGTKINSFGEWFEPEYIKEIITKSKSKNVFITNSLYGELKGTLNELILNKLVVFELSDSLPKVNGKPVDPFKKVDDTILDFRSNIADIKRTSINKVLSQEEFIDLGQRVKRQITDQCGEGAINELFDIDVNLDDDFTITYSSGTTNPTRPKAILHPVRSYMTLSRFKDSDVSGMPKMSNVKVLSHIPPYVHAQLTTSMSDPFFESCTVIQEPIYDKEFFPYSVILNKPNYVCAGAGFWVNFGKKLSFDEKFKHMKLPYLYLATLTGESMSAGEEKFLNRVSREHKFGVEKLPFPLAPVSFSIGGGTGESSGVFVTLFKSLQEKKLNLLLKGESVGLTVLNCADVKIMDKDGKECKNGEPGVIYISGDCNMKGYYYDTDLNDEVMVTDDKGKRWLKMEAFGIKQGKKHIKVKGRLKDLVTLSDGTEYPLYMIEDVVLKDTKNIMSCSIIKHVVGDEIKLILHIEPQPFAIKDKNTIITNLIYRLYDYIPEEVFNSISLRYRDNEESFPVAPSGKRDYSALIAEGDQKAISIQGKDSKKMTLKIQKKTR